MAPRSWARVHSRQWKLLHFLNRDEADAVVAANAVAKTAWQLQQGQPSLLWEARRSFPTTPTPDPSHPVVPRDLAANMGKHIFEFANKTLTQPNVSGEPSSSNQPSIP